MQGRLENDLKMTTQNGQIVSTIPSLRATNQQKEKTLKGVLKSFWYVLSVGCSHSLTTCIKYDSLCSHTCELQDNNVCCMQSYLDAERYYIEEHSVPITYYKSSELIYNIIMNRIREINML